ncbi:MAG: hypothetical protein FD188_3230 [Ignavibacteria bacterium]|nr:MAG: hypothetical protein FD188_3230 [Ignavibacteria bacterium]
MYIVRVISLCINLIRTLAYSQAEYEVYIIAMNSRVVYIVVFVCLFLYLSLLFSIAFRLLSYRLQASLIAFRLVSISLQARLVSPSGSSPIAFRLFCYCLQAYLSSFRLISYRYKAFRLLYYKGIQLSSCSTTVRNKLVEVTRKNLL